MMRKNILATLLIPAMFTAAAANAANIQSQLFYDELNQLSDNSAESQNVDGNGDTLLGLGDTLRGTLQIGTIEDLSGGGGTNFLGAGGVNELTAIFESEVIGFSITRDNDNSCNGNLACDQAGDSLTGDEYADYLFGPNAAFRAEFGLNFGTMIAFFEDSTPDYDRTLGTIAAVETVATNGTAAWEWGMDGSDADELWAAFDAPVDTTLAKGFSPGTILGNFSLQLSFTNPGILQDFNQVVAGCAATFSCADDGLIDVNGSGSILGTSGANTPYDVFNNIDFTIAPIPEPSLLALFGISLFGFSTTRMRKRKI